MESLERFAEVMSSDDWLLREGQERGRAVADARIPGPRAGRREAGVCRGPAVYAGPVSRNSAGDGDAEPIAD
jgi:hypothetical protein